VSITDGLKLTVYFGERDRVGGRLLADELLDVLGAHRIAASVLVRGAAGFGRLHHPRTDRVLSRSEDPPVVAVAIDRRERVEALLEPVRAITHTGLITLQRARLLTGELDRVAWGGAAREPPPASKLTVFVGRHGRGGRVPAHLAVCALLHRHGFAAATVLLGVDGTLGGRRLRARVLSANVEVPAMVVAVGADPAVARVLPELGRLLPAAIAILERVGVCRRDGRRLGRPSAPTGTGARDLAMWQKLEVHRDHGARVAGRPLHDEIARRLRASGAAGATSLRGIWGFQGDGPPHGDRVLQLRRHVPVLTISVNPPERAAEAFAIVDELTAQTGLVTSELVPAAVALGAARPVGSLQLAAPPPD
jgi:PII-like signaling protein